MKAVEGNQVMTSLEKHYRRCALIQCLKISKSHESRWFALERDYAACNERESAEKARASRLACMGITRELQKLLDGLAIK